MRGRPPVAQPGPPGRCNRYAQGNGRCQCAAKANTTYMLGSCTSVIKTVFPNAEHIQSEGLRARVNNNQSERL